MPEEPDEQEEDKKSGGPLSFIKNTPTWMLIGVLAVLFFYTMNQMNEGGSIKKVAVVSSAAFILLYLVGRSQSDTESKTITPEEAERCARKEIERKRKEGQFAYDMKYWIGPNIAPQIHNDGNKDKLTEYWVQLTLLEDGGLIRHKQVRVDAVNGYATIQDSFGGLRGDEVQRTKNVIPSVFKFADQYGLKEWLRP